MYFFQTFPMSNLKNALPPVSPGHETAWILNTSARVSDESIQEAIAAKFFSPIPGTNTGSVDGMTSALTKTLLSNAADILPRIRRKQVSRGWCATEETKAELDARWQDREDARKRLRSAPKGRGLRRALKATSKHLKRTRAEAVEEVLRRLRQPTRRAYPRR